MARIRREGVLIEVLLFFSHKMFIKTFRQIVKLFERTNIFSRKFDKREKPEAVCGMYAAQRVENFERRGCSWRVRSRHQGLWHVATCNTLRQKKEAPLRGPPSVIQRNCSARIFWKILGAKCGQTGFCPS